MFAPFLYGAFECGLFLTAAPACSWDSVPVQIWRYIADRTGIYSYATLPWIWVFSGRNNIFLWATGWQFSTFNIFHRHVARASTIAAIIHSIAYTVFYMLEDPTGKCRLHKETPDSANHGWTSDFRLSEFR